MASPTTHRPFTPSARAVRVAASLLALLGATAGCRTAPAPTTSANAYGLAVVSSLAEYREQVRRVPAKELVDLATAAPGVALDLRYATPENFMDRALYPVSRALLRRPAAEALAAAQRELAAEGLGLKVWDAYRPYAVTVSMWEAIRDPDYVADPAKGSRHNRGCAVDLTLCDLATGTPVRMPSGYDEFSTRANPWYPGGTSEERWLRDLLRRVMEAEGFTVYEHEWWHFDFGEWREYPVMNRRFEEIVAGATAGS